MLWTGFQWRVQWYIELVLCSRPVINFCSFCLIWKKLHWKLQKFHFEYVTLRFLENFQSFQSPPEFTNINSLVQEIPVKTVDQLINFCWYYLGGKFPLWNSKSVSWIRNFGIFGSLYNFYLNFSIETAVQKIRVETIDSLQIVEIF